MDMMGKFLTRSNRSKTQEKEDEDDAWDFISSYRPYNFLFVLMLKIVVVVVVVGIPLESVAPPSTSLCKFVPSIRTGTSQNVLSFWTSKTKNKKTAHHWIIFNRNFFAFLINFSITSRCCCSSSPHMETLTKQFAAGSMKFAIEKYKTPLSLN
jgi:hypothetical protein